MGCNLKICDEYNFDIPWGHEGNKQEIQEIWDVFNTTIALLGYKVVHFCNANNVVYFRILDGNVKHLRIIAQFEFDHSHFERKNNPIYVRVPPESAFGRSIESLKDFNKIIKIILNV